MTTIKHRLKRLEATMGQRVPDHLRVDPDLHWACYVRDGHEEEDFEAACQSAGVSHLGGIALVGIIPMGQEPHGFHPYIERIQIHGPWGSDRHAVA